MEIFKEINEENKLQFQLQNNRFEMFVDICLDWHMEVNSILSAYMGGSETKYKDNKFRNNIINNPRIKYKEKIMSKIEENFSENQIDLITSGQLAAFEFDETLGDYIRISVYDEDNEFLQSFYSNIDTFYYNIDTTTDPASPKFFVKPNEILNSAGFEKGTYTLKFDFLRSF